MENCAMERVQCSSCGKRGAGLIRKRYKLDKNLRQTWALICGACANKEGCWFDDGMGWAE
jgi:hypothetical protein